MDAAEQVLYDVGYAGVTTRAVAEVAGVKHGVVHYYFGSMEQLLTHTLERFVDQLAEALETLYDDPHLSFADKSRLGSQFWVKEPTSRFPKILMELLAVGWNIPALRARLANVHARFRAIFEKHFGRALQDYGLPEDEYPLKVIVAAVTSFQLGLIVEGLSDVNEGHQELLDWIQRWIDSLEEEIQDKSKRVPGRSRSRSSPQTQQSRSARVPQNRVRGTRRTPRWGQRPDHARSLL